MTYAMNCQMPTLMFVCFTTKFVTPSTKNQKYKKENKITTELNILQKYIVGYKKYKNRYTIISPCILLTFRFISRLLFPLLFPITL